MSFVGDIGPANSRVGRLTNVHYDADEAYIAELLRPFQIVDQIRGVNPIRQNKSTVHVLFASVKDKIAACNQFAVGEIKKREWKLRPAPTGDYELNEEGTRFLTDDEVEARKTGASRKTDAAPLDRIDDAKSFPGLGSSAKREGAAPKQKLDKETKARMVCLANVKQDTTDDDIVKFLNPLKVTGNKRSNNVKFKNPTYPITVHVMLESAAERTQALKLKDCEMRGNKIDVKIPINFPKIREGTFGDAPILSAPAIAAQTEDPAPESSHPMHNAAIWMGDSAYDFVPENANPTPTPDVAHPLPSSEVQAQTSAPPHEDVANPAPSDHVQAGKGKEPARDNDKLPRFLKILDDDASGPGRSDLFDHPEQKSSFTRDDSPLVHGDRPSGAGPPGAPESRVLYISNISLKTSDKDVMAFLDGYNPVSLDRPIFDSTGHGMPYAYVLMLTFRDCDRAVTDKNGGSIGGQEVIVEVASHVPQPVLAGLLNLPATFVGSLSSSGILPGLCDIRLSSSPRQAVMPWTSTTPTQVYDIDYYRTNGKVTMSNQGQQPQSFEETQGNIDTAARVLPGRVSPEAERADARRVTDPQFGRIYPDFMFGTRSDEARLDNPHGGFSQIVNASPLPAFGGTLTGPPGGELPPNVDPSIPFTRGWALGDPTVPPVLSEVRWYAGPAEEARVARERADAGNTAADRINREAGREQRREDRHGPSACAGNGGNQ